MYSQTDLASEILAAATELSDDEQLRLLSNERRRAVLDVLADRDAPLAVDEIARAVGSREGGEPRRRTLRVALHHVHLPMLADVGVLEYDPERHRVEAIATSDDRLGG